MEQKLKYGELVMLYAPGITGIYRIKYVKKLPVSTLDLKQEIETGSATEVTINNEYRLVLKDLVPELPTSKEKEFFDMYILHNKIDVIDPMTLIIRLGGGERLFHLKGTEYMIPQNYGMSVWTTSVFPGLEQTLSIRALMYPMHTRANRVAVETIKYGADRIEDLEKTITSYEEALQTAAKKKTKLVVPFYPRLYKMDLEDREPIKFPFSTSFTVGTSESTVHTIPFSSSFQYSCAFVRVTRIIIPNDTSSPLTVTLTDNLPNTNASYHSYKFEVEANKTLNVVLDYGIDFYNGIKGVADANVTVSVEGYYW